MPLFTSDRTPLGLSLGVLAVPSLVLYVMFLVLLRKKRKQHPFDSTFFQLSFYIGLADCVALVWTYLVDNPLRFGWYPFGTFIAIYKYVYRC